MGPQQLRQWYEAHSEPVSKQWWAEPGLRSQKTEMAIGSQRQQNSLGWQHFSRLEGRQGEDRNGSYQ